MPDTRNGHDDIGIQHAREITAKNGLHHVRGVGADHQHFAVRHVDDAHQPEGDRESERREQQHAAEADSIEKRSENARDDEMLLDEVDGMLGRRAHVGVGLDETAVIVLAQQRAQQLFCLRADALRQRLDRRASHRRIGILQADRGRGLFEQASYVTVGFAFKHALYKRQHFLAGAGRQFSRRRQAHVALA